MDKTRTLLLAAALALSACAGTPFQWDDTKRITPGMSESEVIGILGQPYARSQSGNTSVLTWSYKGLTEPVRAVSYRFVDGRVVGCSFRK